MSNDSNTSGDTVEPIAEVTVIGPGISITRPVDEAAMSSIVAILFGASPVSSSGGGGGGRRGTSSGADDSGGAQRRTGQTHQWSGHTLGEFLTETGPKTFPQKICATGYYLTDVKGSANFSRDDVKAALRQAREDMPQNFNRDWSVATSSSFIAAEERDADSFYIPKTGRTAVESNFTDLPKRRAAKKAAKKVSSSSNGDAG